MDAAQARRAYGGEIVPLMKETAVFSRIAPISSLARPSAAWALLAMVVLAALLAACSGAPEPSVVSHAVEISEDNGQIAFARVTLSAPGRVAVEYENEFAGKFRTALSDAAIEHVIPILRLRARAAYEYAVGVERRDGALSYEARGEFVAGEPPGALGSMRREMNGESSLDLIIADYLVRKADDGWERHIVMLDALGHIVWHYEAATNVKTADGVQVAVQGVHIKPGGNIMYLGGLEDGIREITPLGELASEIVSGEGDDLPHHDFIPLDDGRIVYPGRYSYTFDDSANGGGAETTASVDSIVVYDPQSGAFERVWDGLDFWDIRDPAQRDQWNPDNPNWMHLNSLAASPEGGYIAAVRNRNQIISVSPDFSAVRWQLSGPDSDFDFPNPSDRFNLPHTATQLPNGNVLLFDNRAALSDEEGGGEYSRALELRLDFDAKTAVKAWEFSPNPRMFSRVISGAFRLDNGNTLINFGFSEDFAAIPIAIVEADAQGREVFRLETIDPRLAAASAMGPMRYRAYPGPKSIMGETMLRAPKSER